MNFSRNRYRSGMALGLYVFCGWALAANPTVSIDKFTEKTVVQRENKMGTFEATGTYTGIPAAVEVRVVDSNKAKEIRAWKAATLTAGKWKASLDKIPQGGWYYIQARYQGQTLAPTVSVSKFGVGVIIVGAGQSNMGAFCGEWGNVNGGQTVVPHPLTSYATYGWYEWFTQSTVPGKGRAVMLMVNHLAEKLGIPVGFINCSIGSAFIKEYTGDVQAYNRNLVDTLQKGMDLANGKIEAAIWHQGFSDFYGKGSNYSNASTITPDSVKAYVSNHGWDEYEKQVKTGKMPELPYLGKLKKLYNMYSKWLSTKNTPLLVGVKGRSLTAAHLENPAIYGSYITKPPHDWSGGRSRQVDCLRWSQMAFAKNLAYGRPLGSSIDLRFRDGAHYQLEEMSILAARFAQSVLHAIGEASYSGSGPSFNPAKSGFGENGKGILLRVNHEGGNKLVLPYPDKPIEGFIVRQPGKVDPLKIKKISLQDHNGVLIELENQPSGTLLVEYLSGLAPISDIKPGGLTARPPELVNGVIPGNILYDNATLAFGKNRPGLPVNPSLGCIRIGDPAPPDTSKPDTIPPDSPNVIVAIPVHPQFDLTLPGVITSSFVNITYSLPARSQVVFRLYDAQGRLSMQWIDGAKEQGFYQGKRSIGNLRDGHYILHLKAGESTLSRKTVVVR